MTARGILDATHTLQDTIPRAAGRALNGMRLHDVRRVHAYGRTWYSKRRRPLAETTLVAVNAYLRAFGLDVRFLRRAAWVSWETRLHAVLRGTVALKSRQGLLLPEVRGVPLDAYVRTEGVTAQQQEHALRAAATSLAALHRLRVRLDGGGEWPLSHGDAVLRNVLFDSCDGTAHWIDFETRHRPSAPRARRRADDVWTFARSAVFHLGASSTERVAEIVSSTCIDAAVRNALRCGVTAQQMGERLFRLAQAPLAGTTVARLERALLR